MKISIVIPVYNREKFLDRLLVSILKQTYKDYEIILVNDGSIDGSLDKMRLYEEKYNNIIVIDQENSGPGIARKNGFNLCKGELIYFMDSDDYLNDNNFLLEVIETFKRENVDLVLFNNIIVKDNYEKEDIPFDKGLSEGKYQLKDLNLCYFSCFLPGKVFKKNILNENMFFDSNVFEDFYLFYNYLDECNSFFYIKKAYYTLYHKSDNVDHLSARMNVNKEINMLNIIDKTYKDVNNSALKKSIAYYSLNVLTAHMVDFIKKRISINDYIKTKKDYKKLKVILKQCNIKYKPNKPYIFIKKIIFSIYLNLFI